ncbi:MAG: hypothetical protein QM795_09170 [Pseudoxanthomonas sp.]
MSGRLMTKASVCSLRSTSNEVEIEKQEMPTMTTSSSSEPR